MNFVNMLLFEILQELNKRFESSDLVKLTALEFKIDQSHIFLSHEHSTFMTEFFIETADLTFPTRNYNGLPITTLRFMLKELRLLISKSNTISERHVYFYPDTNNFITFQLVDNEVLTIKLVQRNVKSHKNIIHSIFSKEGKIISKNIHCRFNEVFTSIYKLSETLVLDLKDREEVGGDLFVLEEQLRLSKTSFNKFIKNYIN